jgi:hypothetical protein
MMPYGLQRVMPGSICGAGRVVAALFLMGQWLVGLVKIPYERFFVHKFEAGPQRIENATVPALNFGYQFLFFLAATSAFAIQLPGPLNTKYDDAK